MTFLRLFLCYYLVCASTLQAKLPVEFQKAYSLVAKELSYLGNTDQYLFIALDGKIAVSILVEKKSSDFKYCVLNDGNLVSSGNFQDIQLGRSLSEIVTEYNLLNTNSKSDIATYDRILGLGWYFLCFNENKFSYSRCPLYLYAVSKSSENIKFKRMLDGDVEVVIELSKRLTLFDGLLTELIPNHSQLSRKEIKQKLSKLNFGVSSEP